MQLFKFKLHCFLDALSFSIFLFLSLLYADTNGTKETEEASRRSSKVMIAETSTNIVPRPAIALKKSLLKSKNNSSSSSADKPTILDVKATEVRSPSPISEDPKIGEEISKQSTSSAMSNQKEKKIEEKENEQEQQRKKDEEASKKKTLEEQKEERVKDENECQQLRNAQGNNSSNKIEQETSETNKKIDIEKHVESDTKERKSEIVPVQTTKLRGKSKATGQVMGGWI